MASPQRAQLFNTAHRPWMRQTERRPVAQIGGYHTGEARSRGAVRHAARPVLVAPGCARGGAERARGERGERPCGPGARRDAARARHRTESGDAFSCTTTIARLFPIPDLRHPTSSSAQRTHGNTPHTNLSHALATSSADEPPLCFPLVNGVRAPHSSSRSSSRSRACAAPCPRPCTARVGS